MTKTPQEAIIAALIVKLGGKVAITHEEFTATDNLALTRWDDVRSNAIILTATTPPTDEPKELET